MPLTVTHQISTSSETTSIQTRFTVRTSEAHGSKADILAHAGVTGDWRPAAVLPLTRGGVRANALISLTRSRTDATVQRDAAADAPIQARDAWDADATKRTIAVTMVLGADHATEVVSTPWIKPHASLAATSVMMLACSFRRHVPQLRTQYARTAGRDFTAGGTQLQRYARAAVIVRPAPSIPSYVSRLSTVNLKVCPTTA